MDSLIGSSGGGGSRRFRSPRPRKRRDNLMTSLFIIFGVCLLYVAFGGGHDDDATPDEHVFQRRLLQDDYDVDPEDSSDVSPAAKEDDPLFPTDLFTPDQQRQGAVILHIIGIVYMFYALALVCDEFFVPSLDVITEKLKLSPDVAGATFMAAGGSAPELFTSIIGVFIAKSDVGIGTIVGSAVFNILFVIAACAFAAKEALQLTAWPLIRDVFFYSVSLVLLVVFFIDNNIYWWEALILFTWYFAYVGFMKFNEAVEDNLRKCLKLEARVRNPLERGVTLREAKHRKGLFHLMNETINPGILQRKSCPQADDAKGTELKPLNPTNESEIMIGQPEGIKKLQSQMLAGSAATDVSTAAGNGNNSTTSKTEMDDMGSTGEGAQPPPPPPATDSSANQHNNETWASATSNNVEAGSAADKEGEGGEEEEGEEEPPIDMSFPRDGGWKAIIVYLISFPIMAPLFVTLPDTKTKSKQKYFIITFFGSILWIAVFSYLMVWWATTAGNALRIPSQVMGLTFLAAGTSVPDLITSVLVAKKGKGDMAVSSSVGSNIFDICVGLPLPWLLYTAINQTFVKVNSEGVGCSVSLLFLMLVLVFLSILVFKWKMTKGMGIMMMVLYFIFVIVTLGFTEVLQWYKCPL